MYLMPHFSSSAASSAAITPGNSTALVPANNTGTASTIYVNLINEGLATSYDFKAENSQLSVLCIPVGGEAPAQLNPQQHLKSSVALTMSASVVTGS